MCKIKLDEYKKQPNFIENLKNISVKDLRHIAGDIGIDEKAASKKELLNLITTRVQATIGAV
jgi:hypothetical protein